MAHSSDTITIGSITVAREIFSEPFACDLAACKGACCTTPGGYGAPLEQSELHRIEEVLPTVLPLLSDAARAAIAERGFAERTPTGRWATATVDGRECVFAIVENGIALCAFHCAYERGLIDFPKPLSCHLFPVRRSPDGKRLFYERYAECAAAAAAGRQRNSTVYTTARAALERAFGTAWTQEADRWSMSPSGVEEPCRT